MAFAALEAAYVLGDAGFFYRNLAILFWNVYSLDEACATANLYAGRVTEELLIAPDIYSFMDGHGYFEQYLENPGSICSFE